MTGAVVHDPRVCGLGEGALWHPLRETLYWFDITGRRLLWRAEAGAGEWRLDSMHSAAGWIDRDTLLLASETGLWRFSVSDGTRALLCGFVPGPVATRSNDGRADRQGGFWFGTMGTAAQSAAGAIWRWHRGTLRRLFDGLTIPNALCFSTDGGHAYFADTPRGKVMRVALDPEGWPKAGAEVFVDLSAQGLLPDGAVTDAAGRLWIALWGAGRVVTFGPDGRLVGQVALPATQVTCPAFGGRDLTTLFCTSADDGLGDDDRLAAPLSGMTFAVPAITQGLAEVRVILT